MWQLVRIGCGCQKSSFRYNFCIIVNIKKLYGYPKMLKKCVIIFYPLIKMATWLYVYVILCEFSHHLHQLLCYHCVNFCVIIVSTSVLSCVDDRVSFTNTLLQLKMPSEEGFDLNTESTDVVTLLSFFYRQLMQEPM